MTDCTCPDTWTRQIGLHVPGCRAAGCTCPAAAYLTGTRDVDCPGHGSGPRPRGAAADLVIVDDPDELKPALATMRAGEWRITRDDAAATLDLDQLNDTLRRVYADRGRGYQPDPIERQLTDQLPAGLEARWDRTPAGAQLWNPTTPAAFHTDPARREQQRAYLARAFGVPLVDVDPDRLRAEVRLRGDELDRWCDEGGPDVDLERPLPPLVVELHADASRFVDAMRDAVRQLFDPFRRLAEAFVAAGRQLARAFGRSTDPAARRWAGDVPPRRWRDWLPADEPKVDRARRERLDRQRRTLARRAARRRRIATRREQRVRDAGLHGARSLDVLRTAAAGAYLEQSHLYLATERLALAIQRPGPGFVLPFVSAT